jgi:aromatic-L-amino-acid/L-tryptophan decarboxylase
MTNGLEPKSEEIRQMLGLATEKIIEYLSTNETPIPFNMDKALLEAAQQSETIPEKQKPLRDVLEELFNNRITKSYQASYPGHMSYIPGGSIFHSALAGLIANITNSYIGVKFAAPFLVQTESDVIRWFCEMVGFPASSGGIFTSGGSISNLTAAVCARTLILGEDFSKGVVYVSEFIHHSMLKAFQAAGLKSSQVKNIAIDGQFRFDVDSLAKMIEMDQAKGLVPMMIVANAGSTNTGTVDSLNSIAEIAKNSGAWFHVDAAYGGFFIMTSSGKKQLKGIEQADSITLDPHKGLFLPWGTGALIVRDRENLKRVFTHQADYIPESQSNYDLWDFSEMSLELTRPFRGLAIWLPFKMLGVNTFRKALEEKLDLAQYFHNKLKDNQQWEIVAAPDLSITVFRYHDSCTTPEVLNQLNQTIIDLVNSKFRTNISGTWINGNFVIRTCILNFRTHQKHLDWLLEDLNSALSEVKKTLKK